MSMSSVNISITEDVYGLLKGLRREGQSFSDVIRSMVEEKDISKCYGLLSGYKAELATVETEALKARKQKWKEAVF